MSYTPIIIWDVDDVLNCFMESWLKHWNSKNDEDVDFFEITTDQSLVAPLVKYLREREKRLS